LTERSKDRDTEGKNHGKKSVRFPRPKKKYMRFSVRRRSPGRFLDKVAHQVEHRPGSGFRKLKKKKEKKSRRASKETKKVSRICRIRRYQTLEKTAYSAA